MTPIDDDARFDDWLRAGLADRDPGPAPDRLRARVAAGVTEPPSGRRRIVRLVGLMRPAVAAMLTLAAVLVGILVVAVVRPRLDPAAAPQPSPGPGSAAPPIDLGTVGTPIALSIGWVVVVALVVLLAAWAAVESTLRRPSAPTVSLRRLRTTRARGLVVVVLGALVLVGSQLVRDDRSLVPGSFFQASLVHLEGMGQIQSPTTGRDVPAAYFRLFPGGTATVVQAVRNAGSVPLTVTGLTAADSGFELRLFAARQPDTTIDVDTMSTYPFAPFELAPGAERNLVVVIHMAPCPGVPVPSSLPSPDLSGDYQPAAPYGSADFDSVGLIYSVLGLGREADVPFAMTVAVGSPTGIVCGSDLDWASPAPPAAP